MALGRNRCLRCGIISPADGLRYYRLIQLDICLVPESDYLVPRETPRLPALSICRATLSKNMIAMENPALVKRHPRVQEVRYAPLPCGGESDAPEHRRTPED